MRKIAKVHGDDDLSQEEILIYASMNDGIWDIILSNGDNPGFGTEFETLEELERSVEAAWGNWFTFEWIYYS